MAVFWRPGWRIGFIEGPIDKNFLLGQVDTPFWEPFFVRKNGVQEWRNSKWKGLWQNEKEKVYGEH